MTGVELVAALLSGSELLSDVVVATVDVSSLRLSSRGVPTLFTRLLFEGTFDVDTVVIIAFCSSVNLSTASLFLF